MSVVAPQDSTNVPLVISGYECIERIGSGGYGEVWKVRAPGGLLKALKLVFGHFDDERATREMTAVNRMKEVRHPFILSIERVEVVDGRLAIVSELADGSLKERFDACRREGLNGIPRDELIVYMRDAAEALDYLCRTHNLQHLDVKPENLLLVGGRVKVADFGMVKSVQDPSMSQLNSLTPVYAPPEAFDGQPDQRSDQYSLAIVYHELLTGTLPFSGRTTAQLAAQHIYGRPILIRLPVADQPAIMRALAKDPQQRFSSCVALIDALAASGNPPSLPESPLLARDAAESPRETQVIRRAATEIAPVAREDILTVRPRSDSSATRLASLPPIDTTNFANWARPTLFIGLGGIGGRVLGQIQRRLRDRFGERTAIHALQMLYADTNPRAVSEAVQWTDSMGLNQSQVMGLCLQSSSDYRDQSRQLLTWINRRWLYNIPRSLQTEGIRALGRLAFVDHSAMFWKKVESMLTAACDPTNLTSSSAVTGLTFESTAPRIFVIASTSGGSGSGMVLDVAFGLRRLLAERNVSDEHLNVLLVHATDRKAATRDAARASSYACLSELKHFSRRPFIDSETQDNGRFGGFLGLPNAYVTHFGDELSDQQFESAVAKLADFIYRGSVTRAAAFFDGCQATERTLSENSVVTVRSVGTRTLAITSSLAATMAANDVCRTFIDVWRGEPDALQGFIPPSVTATLLLRDHQNIESSRDAEIHRLCQEKMNQSKLNADGIIGNVVGLVQRLVGNNALHWLRKALTKQDDAKPSEQAMPKVQSVFDSLAVSAEPYVEQLSQSMSENLVDWLLKLLSTDGVRVRGARVACDALVECFRNARHRITSQLSPIEANLPGVIQRLNDLTNDRLIRFLANEKANELPPAEQALATHLTQFLQMTLDEIELRGAAQVVARLHGDLKQLGDQLMDLRRELSRLSSDFDNSTAVKDQPATRPWHETAPELASTLKQSLATTMVQLAQQIGDEFFGSPEGLRRTTVLEPEVRGQLPDSLRFAARNIVHRACKEGSALKLAKSASAPSSTTINDLFGDSQTRWISRGVARNLLVHPNPAAAQNWIAAHEQSLGGACAVVADPHDDPLVAVEVDRIPLRDILDQLAEGRTDIPQLAERLYTRIDVNWTSDLA